MTVYDDPEASDGAGGPHPLAGVPQEALDAAREALLGSAIQTGPETWELDASRPEGITVIAEAVLAAALPAIRRADPTAEAVALHEPRLTDGWRCGCGEDFTDRMRFGFGRDPHPQFTALWSSHLAEALR